MKKLFTGFLLFAALLESHLIYAEPKSALEDILELHRKIIFLTSNNDANQVAKERDVFIARNFYVSKRRLAEALEESVLSSAKQAIGVFEALAELIQRDNTRAADALAFIDLIDILSHQQSEQAFLTLDQQRLLKRFERQISLIQASYKDNLSQLALNFPTRGLKLEPWQDYLVFLQKKYHREEIYRQFNNEAIELSEPASRGAETKKDAAELVWGFGIPDKTVVLTFDDGPHYRNTKQILDILKQYQAHAYFFAVGQNIGEIRNGEVVEGTKSDILRRALAEGHQIANHSFSHAVLTKLDTNLQHQELNDTNRLLQSVSGYANTEFRPPYGSKNRQLLEMSADLGMRAVMWNIDSMDWADPVPDSIVQRVMDKLKTDKKGILLFHDIHKQTVQALPKLLQTLKQDGYRIVTLEGQNFGAAEVELVQEPEPEAEQRYLQSQLYGESWALVVGINDYQYWPKLSYAVNDAKGVAEILHDQYGFKSDHIFELYNEKATRENITEFLSDTLADPTRIKPNDRVFIFYAGHGMTRSLPSGRHLGYLIPVDAELNSYSSKSISMTHLQDFSDMIPAKHVYFVMDSCYSGIALTRGGGLNRGSKYLSEISGRRARQILTAGGADQEVADGGPQGHSIFTWSLLQGLSGEADLDKNRIITASELGAYVAPRVSENSHQTPVFGNLVGGEGGDFLFELAQVELDGESLSDEEQLRRALLELQKENAALKQQLAQQANNTSKTPNDVSEIKSMSPSQRRERANVLHKKGLEEYKANDFDTALEDLRQALKYNPGHVGLVNDYGYILYRNGEFDEALRWLEKTIEIDADRIPVYLNIADTLAQLERQAEAVPYYQHYLAKYPQTPVRERVEAFLNDFK